MFSTFNFLNLLSLAGKESDFDKVYNKFIKNCNQDIPHSTTFLKGSEEFRDVVAAIDNDEILANFVRVKLKDTDSPFQVVECNILLYSSFYKEQKNMIIGYEDIENNASLQKTYMDNGADVKALAMAIVDHWEHDGIIQ